MRRSLFLYLFVFAALLALFQYVNARRMIQDKNEEIEELNEELTEIRRKSDSLMINSTPYFSLIGNDDAVTYFENLGYDAKKISQQVKTELISRNRVGEDNELVPFVGMEGEMRINKIKILNHKWIIADFTDGSTWGEIFITYTVNENGELVFETREALLYPKN